MTLSTKMDRRLRKYEETVREWRWVVQRARRGYSECDGWNAHSFLAEIIPGLLNYNRAGYPAYLDSQEEWREIIWKISDGFKAAKTLIDDWPTDLAERKRLEKQWDKGSKLFVKHFFSLWD